MASRNSYQRDGHSRVDAPSNTNRTARVNDFGSSQARLAQAPKDEVQIQIPERMLRLLHKETPKNISPGSAVGGYSGVKIPASKNNLPKMPEKKSFLKSLLTGSKNPDFEKEKLLRKAKALQHPPVPSSRPGKQDTWETVKMPERSHTFSGPATDPKSYAAQLNRNPFARGAPVNRGSKSAAVRGGFVRTFVPLQGGDSDSNSSVKIKKGVQESELYPVERQWTYQEQGNRGLQTANYVPVRSDGGRRVHQPGSKLKSFSGELSSRGFVDKSRSSSAQGGLRGKHIERLVSYEIDHDELGSGMLQAREITEMQRFPNSGGLSSPAVEEEQRYYRRVRSGGDGKRYGGHDFASESEEEVEVAAHLRELRRKSEDYGDDEGEREEEEEEEEYDEEFEEAEGGTFNKVHPVEEGRHDEEESLGEVEVKHAEEEEEEDGAEAAFVRVGTMRAIDPESAEAEDEDSEAERVRHRGVESEGEEYEEKEEEEEEVVAHLDRVETMRGSDVNVDDVEVDESNDYDDVMDELAVFERVPTMKRTARSDDTEEEEDDSRYSGGQGGTDGHGDENEEIVLERVPTMRARNVEVFSEEAEGGEEDLYHGRAHEEYESDEEEEEEEEEERYVVERTEKRGSRRDPRAGLDDEEEEFAPVFERTETFMRGMKEDQNLHSEEEEEHSEEEEHEEEEEEEPPELERTETYKFGTKRDPDFVDSEEEEEEEEEEDEIVPGMLERTATFKRGTKRDPDLATDEEEDDFHEEEEEEEEDDDAPPVLERTATFKKGTKRDPDAISVEEEEEYEVEEEEEEEESEEELEDYWNNAKTFAKVRSFRRGEVQTLLRSDHSGALDSETESGTEKGSEVAPEMEAGPEKVEAMKEGSEVVRNGDGKEDKEVEEVGKLLSMVSVSNWIGSRMGDAAMAVGRNSRRFSFSGRHGNEEAEEDIPVCDAFGADEKRIEEEAEFQALNGEPSKGGR